MGFQLVIAEGSEAGREFVFDQTAVTIGRTPECDVILYDTGVSRKHARILEIGGAFFVEDMGSSNGTLVNGSKVERQLLHEGDAIGLGPVLLNFSAIELGPAAPAETASGDGAHTRIVSVAELKRSRNKGVALLPKGSTRAQVVEMGGKKTGVIPIVRLPDQNTTPTPVAGGDVGASGLARRPRGPITDIDLEPAPKDAPGLHPLLARFTERRAVSAAERARLRRQGPSGLVELWWAEATVLARSLAVSGATVVVLSALASLIWWALPAEKPKLVEPEVLTQEATPYSFGLGPGVTFTHADEKTFEFEVKSPVQVTGVVHFQSKDIGGKEEVSLTVNGTELGWLTPDTLDADEREYEVIIPAAVITRTGINTVTFDNARNPPEKDPWRVWNLWLEISVLPEKDQAGLASDAEEKLRKGDQKWIQRDIGAVNRWEAYKQFREAWLTLEALPPSARPESYLIARQKMSEARVELDNKCRMLLLEARTFFSLKQYTETRFALEHVADFFPSRHHPCQAKAEADRIAYGL